MARPSHPPLPSPPCPEEAGFVDLLCTADRLARGPAKLLRQHDLSLNQYNVLRILRGSPHGLLCGEISQHMISRDPDITRLLDRLQKRNLVERCRPDCDRRRVLARITPAGLHLLAALDEPMRAIHRRQLGHLHQDQLRQLGELLTACRTKIP